jgi:hypothetical protein
MNATRMTGQLVPILCATALAWVLFAIAPSSAIGAACTDMDGDTFTNAIDLNQFRRILFSGVYDAAADFDCDGVVGPTDLNIFKKAFFSPQPASTCC